MGGHHDHDHHDHHHHHPVEHPLKPVEPKVPTDAQKKAHGWVKANRPIDAEAAGSVEAASKNRAWLEKNRPGLLQGYEHVEGYPSALHKYKTAMPIYEAEEAAYLASRKEGGAIGRAVNDIKARFGKGTHWRMVNDEALGKQVALKYEVTTPGKLAMGAGCVASLGVVLHGARNMQRGATGWRDDKLHVDNNPSAQRFLTGAAEVAAGLALLKRVSTGQLKL